jgi:hypothetical protein
MRLEIRKSSGQPSSLSALSALTLIPPIRFLSCPFVFLSFPLSCLSITYVEVTLSRYEIIPWYRIPQWAVDLRCRWRGEMATARMNRFDSNSVSPFRYASMSSFVWRRGGFFLSNCVSIYPMFFFSASMFSPYFLHLFSTFFFLFLHFSTGPQNPKLPSSNVNFVYVRYAVSGSRQRQR